MASKLSRAYLSPGVLRNDGQPSWSLSNKHRRRWSNWRRSLQIALNGAMFDAWSAWSSQITAMRRVFLVEGRSRQGIRECHSNVALMSQKNAVATFSESPMVTEIQRIINISRCSKNVGCRKRYDKTLKNLKPTKLRR